VPPTCELRAFLDEAGELGAGKNLGVCGSGWVAVAVTVWQWQWMDSSGWVAVDDSATVAVAVDGW
jgi:hypothetical protein